MRWSPEEYPDRWEPYEPQERQEAVRVANKLFEDEGYDEEQALRIAEDQVLSNQEGVTTPQGRSIGDNAAYEDDPEAEQEQPLTGREQEPGQATETRREREGQKRPREDPQPTRAHPPSEEQEGPMAANRDQLEQWPRDRLLEYAGQQGLDVDPQTSREEIIDRLSGQP